MVLGKFNIHMENNIRFLFHAIHENKLQVKDLNLKSKSLKFYLRNIKQLKHNVGENLRKM